MGLYYFTNIQYILWIGIITSITCFCNYLIIRSSSRQPENINSTNILKIVGLVNVMMVIVVLFIPRFSIYTTSQPEYDIFKIYQFSVNSVLRLTTFLTYGVLLIIFAKKNSENLQKYMLTGGILMCVADIFMITAIFLRYFYIIDLPIANYRTDFLWYLFIILQDLENTVYVCSLIFFIIYGLKYNKYFVYAFLLIMIRDTFTGDLYMFISRML